ncbi:hypothetical protein Hdeb2414_s0013g00411801 [Helianthus debilis subsp. tardiflorus]
MVLVEWKAREEGEEINPFEAYANEPTLFTLQIFHSGEFVKFPGRKYVNGKVTFFDYADSDEFSMHELNIIFEKPLGYSSDEVMYYYFKIPDQDLDVGLRCLGNDKDVLDMIQYVNKFKVIQIYTEHWVTKLNGNFQVPGQGNNVIIQEIIDDGPPTVVVPLIEWHEHGDVGNMSDDEGNMSDNENVVHGDERNMSDNENVVHGDEGNMSDNENVVHGDVGNMSNDEFVAHFIDPFVQNRVDGEGPYETEDGQDSIVDKDNMVEEVVVDMNEFKSAIVMDVDEEVNAEDDMDSIDSDAQ